jgi:metal-responsive CopG/Arc/MetJ family transcriptional regulator
MAHKEERIVLTMPSDLVERIDDYRFARRLLSRAAAIRALIALALDTVEKPPTGLRSG